MRNTLKTCTGIALTFALANSLACYSYLPLAVDAVPKSGERVRLELTPKGTTELTRYLGPRVVEVEGLLTSMDGEGSLIVAVDNVRLVTGERQPWNGEGSVTFPRDYVARTHARTFKQRRTVVASAALAVALIAVTAVALKVRGSGGGGKGPPPPPP